MLNKLKQLLSGHRTPKRPCWGTEGDPAGADAVKKWSGDLQFEYRANADAAVFEEIGHGVVFIMAFWSGPAVSSFTKFAHIASAPEYSGLKVVVVDTDGIPELYEHEALSRRLGGWGEAIFLKEGKILAVSTTKEAHESYEVNLKWLVEPKKPEGINNAS